MLHKTYIGKLKCTENVLRPTIHQSSRNPSLFLHRLNPTLQRQSRKYHSQGSRNVSTAQKYAELNGVLFLTWLFSHLFSFILLHHITTRHLSSSNVLLSDRSRACERVYTDEENRAIAAPGTQNSHVHSDTWISIFETHYITKVSIFNAEIL